MTWFDPGYHPSLPCSLTSGQEEGVWWATCCACCHLPPCPEGAASLDKEQALGAVWSLPGPTSLNEFQGCVKRWQAQWRWCQFFQELLPKRGSHATSPGTGICFHPFFLCTSAGVSSTSVCTARQWTRTNKSDAKTVGSGKNGFNPLLESRTNISSWEEWLTQLQPQASDTASASSVCGNLEDHQD